MRRVAFIIIFIVVLILLGIWSPWRGLSFNIGTLFGINEQEVLSALQVNSLSGTIQVYVDNILKGEVTPETSPIFIDSIEPGEHLVKLVRKTELSNAYWTFNKLVKFTQNTNVVISYNLGPEEVFSEGNIIYTVDKDDITNLTNLRIRNNIENFSVQFDSLPVENVSLNEYFTNLDLNKQHFIRLIKPGYEPLEFTILPSAQEERDKLADYNLIIESQMMLQPVTVEDVLETL